jgi:hypothetical protein
VSPRRIAHPLNNRFDSCTRASDPYIAPDPDLAPIMEESIQREMDRRAAERCVTCGDPLDMADADNFTRRPGMNKAGRIDCGKCVRGMRRQS